MLLLGVLCRVCELEGKVRELESSMARMGAQHDVNMELIATFRHQKETVSAGVSPIARYSRNVRVTTHDGTRRQAFCAKIVVQLLRSSQDRCFEVVFC